MSDTPTTNIFVATDLDCREQSPATPDDIIVEGKCYRRLSPEYYAWLRQQMERARQHHDGGIIPTAHYETLRQRFNTVHDRAVTLFSEEILLQTINTFTAMTYPVPSVRKPTGIGLLLCDAGNTSSDAPANADTFADKRVSDSTGSWWGHIVHCYPADIYFPHGWAEILTDDGQRGEVDLRCLRNVQGTPLIANPQYTAEEQRAIKQAHGEKPADFTDLESTLPILSFAVPGDWSFHLTPPCNDYLKVNVIRERAHALNWTDIDLFQTTGNLKFPGGQDYGLVCYLRGRTIKEVTSEWISFQSEKPGSAMLKFQRPNRTIKEN